MPRLTRRGLLAGLSALAGLKGSALAENAAAGRFGWENVTARVDALSGFSILEPGRRDFGELTFLGGLEIRADHPDFGGLSSGTIDAAGKAFIAASDQAHWIIGRFVTDAEERLLGLENLRIGVMKAPDGRPMNQTRLYDTEGMVRQGNRLFLSVEGAHQILRFEIGPDGPGGRAVMVPSPDGLRGLNRNQGIEALGLMPPGSRSPGSLIAIAEHAPKEADAARIPGWIIGGPMPGAFFVARSGDFDITDLGFLPGGDLLLLERRFSPFSGVAMRIRRIPLAEIAPGMLLDGAVLIEANMACQIDNMEALMIHPATDGRVILTLLSDDNFSILQRNLVLRFAYRA